ncbi:hypothetical protein TI10_18345 [Photorhabdus luminescens subsp. luminescens]|nr:hypothetical protein TI10_18345 [Photorhabdus luminescens subsp. luminescens]
MLTCTGCPVVNELHPKSWDLPFSRQLFRASQGRRLRALCRPRPQNGHPPPRQAGRRSPVAEKGAPLTRARREKPAFGGEKRVREFWVRR